MGGAVTQEGAPGRLIGGRYRLAAELGSGGMGRVWEGQDELLGRPVAVKEVRLRATSPEERDEGLTRAQREGRNAAVLADHPNVVTVYDVVIEDGVPWTVMQLVRGRSLRQELTHGPLDPDHVPHIAAALLSALRAADAAALVHRDVKPGNVLLADDGRVLLADFGIARIIGDETITAPGAFVGSFEYTSPERADGRPGGLASDLFSLGLTLFHAVEGYPAFRRDSRTATLSAVLLAPLPEMKRARGGLRELITALTAKDPEQRPGIDTAITLLRGGGRPRTGDTTAVTAVVPAPDGGGGATLTAGSAFPPHTPHSPGAFPPHTPHPSDGTSRKRAGRLPVTLAGVSSLTVVMTVGAFLMTHPGGDAPSEPPPAVTTSASAPAEPGRLTGPGGTCLDVRGKADGGDHARAELGRCRSSAAGQLWTQRPDGALETLRRCLGPVDDEAVPDTPVELQDCTGADGQKWAPRSDGSLFHARSGRCLAPDGTPRDGVRLLLRDCTGSADQKFTLP